MTRLPPRKKFGSLSDGRPRDYAGGLYLTRHNRNHCQGWKGIRTKHLKTKIHKSSWNLKDGNTRENIQEDATGINQHSSVLSRDPNKTPKRENSTKLPIRAQRKSSKHMSRLAVRKSSGALHDENPPDYPGGRSLSVLERDSTR